MPQDMPPVGGYEAVQYKVGLRLSFFMQWTALMLSLGFVVARLVAGFSTSIAPPGRAVGSSS